MVVSKELYGYLVSWIKWVEDGAPEHDYFNRKYGLCTPALDYEINVHRELTSIFLRMYLDGEVQDRVYPFGYADYIVEQRDETQHENAARLKWVRDQIKAHEETYHGNS